MYKAICTFIVSMLLLGCAAQRTAGGVQIFAYRQVMLGGPAPPVITDEKGNVKEIPMKERAEYFIYIEMPSSNMKVVDLWLRKDYYGATTQEVSTPVVRVASVLINASPDTLVKRTSNKVLRVYPGPPGNRVTPSRSLQNKINANELVLHYVVDGKDFYYTIPAIKNLAPVALQ